ncbi:MAG: hypothetical protein R2780_08500 [Crocinitomicaceae bacterium]
MKWLFPIGMLGFIALGGLVVMLLWNGIMPAVFGLGMVTFWQALGMLILGRLLFGGFKKHRHYGMRHAYCHVHTNCGPHDFHKTTQVDQ